MVNCVVAVMSEKPLKQHVRCGTGHFFVVDAFNHGYVTDLKKDLLVFLNVSIEHQPCTFNICVCTSNC